LNNNIYQIYLFILCCLGINQANAQWQGEYKFGVQLNIGTHVQKLGVLAFGSLANQQIQLNNVTAISFNLKNLGEGKQFWELQQRNGISVGLQNLQMLVVIGIVVILSWRIV
jgi:hypothetical protein